MKNNFIPSENEHQYMRRQFAPKIVSRRLINFLCVAYMADILDLPNCATVATEFNTGTPLCDLIKKKIIGVIFADSGVYFSPSHRATTTAFLTELATKTLAARGSRAYPLWDIRNYDDQTGEPTKGGVGNLTTSQVVTADGIPAFRFGYNAGEIQHQILSNIESGQYDMFLVDEGYTVYGTKDGVNLKGFSTEQIYVNPSKFQVTDRVNQYSFDVTLASMIEYKQRSGFVVTNSTITAKVGLINITMSEFSLTSNVLKAIMTAAGGTNLEPLYGAALDGLTWTAIKDSDGSAFTITSVATDATNDAMTVTFDSTMFTALASGATVTLYGPTPAAMSAVGIAPFEFVPYTVTKP